MNANLEHIIKTSKIHPTRVSNVYLFGSRVYGTATFDSDWDVIMVAKNSIESTEIRSGLYNIHVYTPDKFAYDLKQHRINNIECIMSPDEFILKDDIDYSSFKINKQILRHSLSRTSSNSWVKARKKIEVENERYIGIKSLFHSIRIPMFGIQISRYGKIEDFSCANYILDDLIKNYYTWNEMDKKYRPILNKTMTEFRDLTPKY